MREQKSISLKAAVIMVLVTVVVMMMGGFVLLLRTMQGSSGTDIVATAVKTKLMEDAQSAPQIDVSYMNNRFREMGELTTAEMSYDGLLRYDQGNIPLLTKHGFLMSYTAYVRAGIDFSQVRVRLEGDAVKVFIPEAVVQVMYVDPESIAIYDESHALFEGDGKDHLKTALVNAEADAAENLDTDMVLERAYVQAEKMVTGLVSQLAYGAEIEIERR